MQCIGTRLRRALVTAALVVAPIGFTAAALPHATATPFDPVVDLVTASAALAQPPPSLDRDMKRTMTRADRTVTRFGTVMGYVGMLWLWAGVNTLVFLAVTALASIADLRMLTPWRHGGTAIAHYLISGVRTFWRLLRDRRTPFSARVVLAFALLYWLSPIDLVEEGFFMFEDGLAPLGFVEDLFIAVVAAKLFMYLCPDTLVAQHAAAVEARVEEAA